MTGQDKHCKHAGILKGPAKIAYMRENGITSEQVFRYGVTHKDTGSTRAKKMKTRTRVLASQGGCCALCGKADASQWCLNESGKVACHSCNIFLTQYRKLRAGGVECEDMEAFIE